MASLSFRKQLLFGALLSVIVLIEDGTRKGVIQQTN